MTVLVCLLVLSVAASAARAQGGPDPEAGTPAPERLTVDRQSSDADIDDRLTRILDASGWFRDPRVDVREGIVFLDGTTDTEQHRDWAGSLAGNTEDVVAVVNRIAVEPEVSWDFRPAWNEIKLLLRKAQQAVPLFVLGLVILFVAYQAARLAARAIRWSLRGRIDSPLLVSVAARAIAIPIFLLGLYLVLQISGLTRLAITVLGGTGLAGIVLGFAFRDIAENFLASLILSIRNPFHAGDYIRLGEHEGIVRNLNTRTTVLLTQDGNHVQIPNATVFKSVITNYSSNPSRRAEFTVGIGYDDSTSKAQEIIEGVLKAHPAVRDDPPAFVVVEELAASTVNLTCYFWYDSTTYSPFKLRSALMRQTKRALLDGGVSMPDEAREVIFPQGLPVYRMSEPGGPAAETQSAEAAASEADASSAEGGLDKEEDDLLRDAGATKSPDEKENLLD